MVAVSLVPIASVSILLPILIVICCNVHTTNSVRLGDINPSAWDLVTQRMEIALNDSEFKGEVSLRYSYIYSFTHIIIRITC